MNKKLAHCPDCDKNFLKQDEVVVTNASGAALVVHVNCLDGWMVIALEQSKLL